MEWLRLYTIQQHLGTAGHSGTFLDTKIECNDYIISWDPKELYEKYAASAIRASTVGLWLFNTKHKDISYQEFSLSSNKRTVSISKNIRENIDLGLDFEAVVSIPNVRHFQDKITKPLFITDIDEPLPDLQADDYQQYIVVFDQEGILTPLEPSANFLLIYDNRQCVEEAEFYSVWKTCEIIGNCFKAHFQAHIQETGAIPSEVALTTPMQKIFQHAMSAEEIHAFLVERGHLGSAGRP